MVLLRDEVNVKIVYSDTNTNVSNCYEGFRYIEMILIKIHMRILLECIHEYIHGFFSFNNTFSTSGGVELP